MTVELKNILDLEKWEKLQESLALSTRLAIILVDYKGRPVTKHSQVQPFCQLVRHSLSSRNFVKNVMLVVAWKLFALVSLLSTVVTLTSLIWPSPLLLITSM